MKKTHLAFMLFAIFSNSYAQTQDSISHCLSDEKEAILTLHLNYLSDSNTVALYNEIIKNTQQDQIFTKMHSTEDANKVLQIILKQNELRFADAEESSFQKELLKSDCPVIKLGEGVLLMQNNLTEKDVENIDVLRDLLSHTTKITPSKEDLLATHYFLATPFYISGASGGYFVIPMEKATNEDINKKPVECGTGRIIQMQQEQYKKTIEDFIAASKKNMMFGNGIWMTIGKQNTDEDILKAGFKDSSSPHENIQILKSMDHGDYHYILFSTQKEGQKADLRMALYDKVIFSFRGDFDPFYYKNYYNPEVLGKWIMSEAFSRKKNETLILKPLVNDYDYGYFLEIKEDYSFEMYDKGDCPAYERIKGRYYFDEKGINFYCYDIQYLGKKKEGKSFTSGPFIFKKENGVLTLKKIKK
ncbi:hypothetical protein [Chryseobacterium soli]|nr:hypothetical protein [Chryseobacterium soli]